MFFSTLQYTQCIEAECGRQKICAAKNVMQLNAIIYIVQCCAYHTRRVQCTMYSYRAVSNVLVQRSVQSLCMYSAVHGMVGYNGVEWSYLRHRSD